MHFKNGPVFWLTLYNTLYKMAKRIIELYRSPSF